MSAQCRSIGPLGRHDDCLAMFGVHNENVFGLYVAMDGTGDSNSNRSDEEGIVAQRLECVHSTPSSRATSLPSASRASIEGSVEDEVWIKSDNCNARYLYF